MGIGSDCTLMGPTAIIKLHNKMPFDFIPSINYLSHHYAAVINSPLFTIYYEDNRSNNLGHFGRI
jgi:hypothetical protein